MQIIRSRNYLGNPGRSPAQIDDAWLRRMKALADPRPRPQLEDPQHEQTLDASDLAWVEKMLILAGEEQEQPSTKAYDMDDDELWLAHMLELAGEERNQQ